MILYYLNIFSQLEKIDEFEKKAFMAFDVGIEDELNICKYCIIKLQSFASEESCIDVMEFEKILRMSTGDELDKDEIKMVIMKNNFKKVIFISGS